MRPSQHPLHRRTPQQRQHALRPWLLLGLPLMGLSAHAQFVGREDETLILEDEPWVFGGANNYYLSYSSEFMVDSLLLDALAMDLRVIRMQAYIDCGALDGSVPSVIEPCDVNGVFFQYWDPETGMPAYNDGENGLERLDYAIAEAGALGLKLILPLTNNWIDFGGMDQYLYWYDLDYHDQFYTDTNVRTAFQAWIDHLVHRINVYTGERYRDDPTILGWELANEPRCDNGNLPASEACTPETLVNWVDETSTFLRSIDPNHLIMVGDEGMFNWEESDDILYDGSLGGDFEAFLDLPNIDVGTFHLYPDLWGRSAEWGISWIEDHVDAAFALGKPVILEEFGLQNKQIRDEVYEEWTGALKREGANGFAFWMLASETDEGTLYPDYDGFTVYYPSSTADVLSEAARAMAETNETPEPTPEPTPVGCGAPAKRYWDDDSE